MICFVQNQAMLMIKSKMIQIYHEINLTYIDIVHMYTLITQGKTSFKQRE